MSSLGNRFKRMADPPKEGSGNIDLPEAETPPPPKPIVEAVQRPRQEGRGEARKLLPGDARQPERKSVADIVDGRVLASTGRVRPLNLALTDETQDEFRAEAIRRRNLRLGNHQLNELFEMAWAAYKRENGMA